MKSRHDFQTEEEWQRYKEMRESAPKALSKGKGKEAVRQESFMEWFITA